MTRIYTWPAERILQFEQVIVHFVTNFSRETVKSAQNCGQVAKMGEMSAGAHVSDHSNCLLVHISWQIVHSGSYQGVH